MTNKEIDAIWDRALRETTTAGDRFIRYHFAKLVAEHERSVCEKVAEKFDKNGLGTGFSISIQIIKDGDKRWSIR